MSYTDYETQMENAIKAIDDTTKNHTSLLRDIINNQQKFYIDYYKRFTYNGTEKQNFLNL